MVRIFIPRARLPPVSPQVAPAAAAGPQAQIQLDADEAGYLTRVRRLRSGDPVEVFDGLGGRCAATVGPGLETLLLGASLPDSSPRRFSFELWPALTKGDKVEWVIQKATELGLARLVPLVAERSVVKLAGERAVARVARFRKIAQEAARQCGRADVPEVTAPAGLADFGALAQAGVTAALVYERETRHGLAELWESVPDGGRVAFAIGPEGGFSTAEVALALGAGARPVGLGDLILRAETAAIAVCTLAAAAAGALGPPRDR